MKYELKIEFKEKDQLESIIQKSYFEDGTMGKLVGKKLTSRFKKKIHFLLYLKV